MSRRNQIWKLPAAAALLIFAACGQTPQTTQDARGVFEGLNLFVALTVALVAVSGLLLVGAVALDRYVRTRRALEEGPPAGEESERRREEEEEEEELVAGIRVGRAPVPRWLYGAYVVIPLFAVMYVVANIAPAPTVGEPEPTPAPTGPQSEATLAAQNIVFDRGEVSLLANTEVTLTLDNQDAGVPHDLTVWEDQGAAQRGDEAGRIAGTPIFNGVDSRSFSLDSGPPRTLYYNCTVHPASMFGDLVVEEE